MEGIYRGRLGLGADAVGCICLRKSLLMLASNLRVGIFLSSFLFSTDSMGAPDDVSRHCEPFRH